MSKETTDYFNMLPIRQQVEFYILRRMIQIWDHSFSMYVKLSEKLTFLFHTYMWVSGNKKYLFFGNFCEYTK